MNRLTPRTLLLGLGALGALTAVAAVLQWWAVAVVGLVLLHLGTALAVLGPWRSGGSTKSSPAASSSDLERRIDALDARLTASAERTRVDVLDALTRGRGPAGPA